MNALSIFLFFLFAVIIVVLLLYIKKHKPINYIDKTAWDKNERLAIDVLNERLATGDITKEEYEEKKKEIEIKS